MTRTQAWAAAVLGVTCNVVGCGENCLGLACWDTLNVTVQLPSEPGTYTFTLVTDQGQTSCEIEVPVQLGRDCENSSFVRFAPKERTDGTIAEIAIRDSTSAEVRVARGDEEVFVGTVSAEPGSRVQVEGTGDDCSGPCYRTTASLDLTGLAP